MKLLFLGLLLALSDQQSITVKAISHELKFTDSNGRQITCVGSNCSTYGGFQWVEITQVVESQGTRYTLSCSGVPFKSAVYRYCEWLHFDGDQFAAEIKGKDMTVHARSGGNQGKEIKLKFKIVDIRGAN
jgi:hypothetical protein